MDRGENILSSLRARFAWLSSDVSLAAMFGCAQGDA